MNLDITSLGLDSILTFEVVARLRSLKLASSELAVSQPAVTHSLNKLEDRLNTQLCIRSRTYFALTESGEKLYKVATNIKEQLVDYQSFLRDDEEFDGLFSLSVVDNFKNESFSLALEKMIKKYPKMKLNIQVQSAKEIQDSVLKGESDVGFGIFNNKYEALTYRKIGEEVLHYYISDKHQLWGKKNIIKNDLNDKQLVWVDTVFRSRSNLESHVFINSNSKMKVTAYTNNLNCALSILKSGDYVVPLPNGYLEEKKLDFKYKALRNIKTMTLGQSITYRGLNAKKSKILEAFLEFLKT
ncbi:MAG: LysR family transcriptional regulator [Bdellovibrionales bacterium]|nr:LysR family transcriptional regulator [Bdellovibrionales bacterium]